MFDTFQGDFSFGIKLICLDPMPSLRSASDKMATFCIHCNAVVPVYCVDLMIMVALPFRYGGYLLNLKCNASEIIL